MLSVGGVFFLLLFSPPCSFWSTWLIPIFGALVIGLMYRYYMLEGRSSWAQLDGTSESLKEHVWERVHACSTRDSSSLRVSCLAFSFGFVKWCWYPWDQADTKPSARTLGPAALPWLPLAGAGQAQHPVILLRVCGLPGVCVLVLSLARSLSRSLK